MVQPAVRILTARDAHAAARALETPAEVRDFEAMGPGSATLRTFFGTPEWAAIRTRIVGDGTPITRRPRSVQELAQLMRWNADDDSSEIPLTGEARAAYLHAAAEIEAYGRSVRRAAPGSVQELAQLMRWNADDDSSEIPLTGEARAAYLHAAAEIEAYGRSVRSAAPAPVGREPVCAEAA